MKKENGLGLFVGCGIVGEVGLVGLGVVEGGYNVGGMFVKGV